MSREEFLKLYPFKSYYTEMLKLQFARYFDNSIKLSETNDLGRAEMSLSDLKILKGLNMISEDDAELVEEANDEKLERPTEKQIEDEYTVYGILDLCKEQPELKTMFLKAIKEHEDEYTMYPEEYIGIGIFRKHLDAIEEARLGNDYKRMELSVEELKKLNDSNMIPSDDIELKANMGYVVANIMQLCDSEKELRDKLLDSIEHHTIDKEKEVNIKSVYEQEMEKLDKEDKNYTILPSEYNPDLDIDDDEPSHDRNF